MTTQVSAKLVDVHAIPQVAKFTDEWPGAIEQGNAPPSTFHREEKFDAPLV